MLYLNIAVNVWRAAVRWAGSR